mmetsp:Transcript_3083/g.5437  ORF Transcript_3083/g.5437 Transcript_3083/m.5437 type:complete len:336 (+) Transcript_3083:146-1153(+)|eukprot:CAMPEP_0196658750 /NCGR_PEP_ID=MMETSP1086-20130531/31267_1 /TAXON_ID=77921 /ORGANISM="Cyanoptyche  gloeocystis , Strain SAG4.97" /LENGTH=335 /DNA_ID=CAMNT_0041992457 /DNA_START=145 /DNA_END=1152 /DNA_ORIENTATION=-
MLAANKQALEASLKQSSMEIRNKELLFFNQNNAALATQAALLAGFSYSGLSITVAGDGNRATVLRLLYYFFTTCALGFELLTLINATFCNMFGPGLALRGPDGSMQRAVDGMNVERIYTFWFFCVGMACFHFSGMFVAWLRFKWPEALVINIILLCFLWSFWHYGKRIHARFQIPVEQLVSGEFSIGGFNPEMVGGITCPTCKTSIPPSCKFCTGCGRQADHPRVQSNIIVACDRCGQALLQNVKFCGSCGAEAQGNKTGVLSGMSLEASLAFPRFSSDKRRVQNRSGSTPPSDQSSSVPSFDEQFSRPVSPTHVTQKQSLLGKLFPTSSADLPP